MSGAVASNAYESDNRLIAGNAKNGGLADVNNNWHNNENDNIGFRVLAVLSRLFPTANHLPNFCQLQFSGQISFLI